MSKCFMAIGAIFATALWFCGASAVGKDASHSVRLGPAAVLDRSLGGTGVVQFPLPEASENPGALGVEAENGSLAVSDGTSVQLLSAIGAVGEAFGGTGTLALPAAPGREFLLRDFTVDQQGRLVVVGSSYYPAAENESPRRKFGVAFQPAALRVLRFLPGGGLDPSFAMGGAFETTLGLPAPLGSGAPGQFGAPGTRRLGTHPAVRATGVVVDSQGRIVVTGDAVARLGRTCTRNAYEPAVIKAGFLARITEDGALDPAFGEQGLVGGRHFGELPLGGEVVEEPVVSPDGSITYRSSAKYACERKASHLGIAQLTPTGQARNAFGERGALEGRGYRAIAGGPDGSVFAIATALRSKYDGFEARVTKISPNGQLDGSFGTKGSATIRLSNGFSGVLNALAIDLRGRVLMGGSFGIGKGRSMVLARLSSAGKQEMTFGPMGRVATRVQGLGDPSALFFDGQGRVVTVHPYANIAAKRSGLVVARYLLRN